MLAVDVGHVDKEKFPITVAKQHHRIIEHCNTELDSLTIFFTSLYRG
jgi:hypothetical protein